MVKRTNVETKNEQTKNGENVKRRDVQTENESSKKNKNSKVKRKKRD